MRILATVLLESHLRTAQKAVPPEWAEREAEAGNSKVNEAETSLLRKMKAFHSVFLAAYIGLENFQRQPIHLL